MYPVTLIALICAAANPEMCAERINTNMSATVEKCEEYVEKHLRPVLPYSGRFLKSHECRKATPEDMAKVSRVLCMQDPKCKPDDI